MKTRRLDLKWLLIIVLLILIFMLLKKQTIRNDTKLPSPVQNTQKLCNRQVPYPMQPEFGRALNLLYQRLNENEAAKPYGISFASIHNCLNIQYAESDDQIKGTEGVFYFVPGGDKQKLDILVSPRYKANDDILTALLLSHEVTHAFAHITDAYKGLDPISACYEDEAEAFMTEYIFTFTLNKGERNSLIARLNQDNDPTVSGWFDTMDKFITKDVNGNPRIDTLPYVKSRPFYQKQCEAK